MKKFILILLLTALAFSAGAKDIHINGKDYSVDTMVVRHQVGPGTYYAYYSVPNRPLTIHVLEMDMTNPYLTMEVWNGGQAAVACETPTSVYNRYEKKDIQVIAAHNGDFFTTNLGETGISRMGLIGADDIIFNPTGNPLFVIDDQNKPWIDYVHFGGHLYAGDKETRIHTVNQLRLEWEPATYADQLSLYTPAFGSKMHANSTGGTVAVVTPVSGNVAFPNNRPIEMKVVERKANPGQIEIPEDGAVLHGVGASATFLDALEPGQIVTVSLTTAMPSYPDVRYIREAMGGSGHIILRNGEITNINNPECHPRTFMGISKDQKTIWSVIVDGRWASSAGIDLDDQGRVLQWLGAWDGINLDGGGSSCMVVNGEIKNHPSDGSERAVGNGVLFYSIAPADWKLERISFPPGNFIFPVGAIYTPNIYGYNKYGQLVSKNVSGVNLSTDDPIGIVDSRNTGITMSATPVKGVLKAMEWGYNTSCSTPVEVVFAEAKASVENIVISNNHDILLPLTAQVGPFTYSIDPSTVEWESSNPSVVEAIGGKLSARENGTAVVTGKSAHFKGSFNVTAESYGSYNGNYTHDVFADYKADELNLKQSGGTNITAVENGRGFNITYTGNGSARGSYIQIGDPTGKIETKGTPGIIYLTINPVDAPVNQITMNYSDQLGNRGTLTFEPATNDDKLEANKTVTLSTRIPAVEQYSYPFTFSGLRFTMGASTKGTDYKIEIPEFYYYYSIRAGVEEVTADQPVNGAPEGTYDLSGRRVDDEPAAPGLYIKNGEKVLVR